MSDEAQGPAGTRVEFKVALKGRALVGQAEPEAPSTDTPLAEKIPRVARLLALAHRWQRLIDEGRVRDQAQIARLMGLSRARVTQIIELRWLAPAVQEAVLLANAPVNPQAAWCERELRRIVRHDAWREQAAGPHPVQLADDMTRLGGNGAQPGTELRRN